jgi:hypothetical protein
MRKTVGRLQPEGRMSTEAPLLIPTLQKGAKGGRRSSENVEMEDEDEEELATHEKRKRKSRCHHT